MRKVTKPACRSQIRQGISKKNKLLPAPDFLFGVRITATSAGKSVHPFAGPPAFR